MKSVYLLFSSLGCRPRIIGLAPWFLNDKVRLDDLSQSVSKLEAVTNSSLETVSDLMVVLKCGNRCTCRVVSSKTFVNDFDFSVVAVRILSSALRFCRNSHFFNEYARPVVEAFSKILSILEELGPWCAWRTCLIYERHLNKLNKSSVSEPHQLFIQLGQTYIRAAKKILEKHVKSVDSVAKLEAFVPDRVVRLLNILKSHCPVIVPGQLPNPASEFAGVVFVQRRYTAYILKLLLKKVQSWDVESFGYLKVDFMVGYSSSNLAMEDSMALHRRQEEVKANFRQKILNLLISTSILEDGVELRQCNIVVRYDIPLDFRSYLQSKGRARKRDSIFYFLVDQEVKEAFAERFKTFLLLEKVCSCSL
ncbi:unnamed protein product [Soboliphyme baturini]|uniref:Helicase C-terminal domain-containing protein n=1 Tax=Soboliphyme baturini TaxID=241478 RepID=A0A183J9F0_9BILA|nr:unnamed protein product [Soboliphyme baturini]